MTKLTAKPTAQERKLVWEVYQNFPEAGVCVSCIEWNHGKFKFVFQDEEGKEHVVRMPDAIRGLRLFVKAVMAGELKGLGLPAHFLSDTGEWDSFAFDALNQFAIYGEVIYG